MNEEQAKKFFEEFNISLKKLVDEQEKVLLEFEKKVDEAKIEEIRDNLKSQSQ